MMILGRVIKQRDMDAMNRPGASILHHFNYPTLAFREQPAMSTQLFAFRNHDLALCWGPLIDHYQIHGRNKAGQMSNIFPYIQTSLKKFQCCPSFSLQELDFSIIFYKVRVCKLIALRYISHSFFIPNNFCKHLTWNHSKGFRKNSVENEFKRFMPRIYQENMPRIYQDLCQGSTKINITWNFSKN